MKRLLLAPLLLLVSTAGGCVFYGDDDPCYYYGDGAPEYAAGLRNPDTGQCDYWGGGGGGNCGDDIYGADAEAQALPDWGSCPGVCDGLTETDCLASSGCRAAYLDDALTDSDCAPGVDCGGGEGAFWGCWDVAPSGPIQGGDCWALDAYSCSQHDDCVAHYTSNIWADAAGLAAPETQFSYCAPEPWSVGCYSDADCPGGYECSADTECLPPPGCDGTGDCPAVCYGSCQPVQNGCEAVDCAPGYHCELQCYPCDDAGEADGATPGPTCTDYPCEVTCVPDYNTCDSTLCEPGSHCETVCSPPDPACEGGPMGCADSCWTECIPDYSDPGTCDGEVFCDSLPPSCPVNTTPGISNGCWTGYCIPLTDCNPTDPGTCDQAACDMASPSCPDGTVPGVANGCYTGYCIPSWACGSDTSCESIVDEAACNARQDCTASYSGNGCTCFPDGSCSCDEWTFLRCESGGVMPF